MGTFERTTSGSISLGDQWNANPGGRLAISSGISRSGSSTSDVVVVYNRRFEDGDRQSMIMKPPCLLHDIGHAWRILSSFAVMLPVVDQIQ
jgi:hypothetical protein